MVLSRKEQGWTQHICFLSLWKSAISILTLFKKCCAGDRVHDPSHCWFCLFLPSWLLKEATGKARIMKKKEYNKEPTSFPTFQMDHLSATVTYSSLFSLLYFWNPSGMIFTKSSLKLIHSETATLYSQDMSVRIMSFTIHKIFWSVVPHLRLLLSILKTDATITS